MYSAAAAVQHQDTRSAADGDITITEGRTGGTVTDFQKLRFLAIRINPEKAQQLMAAFLRQHPDTPPVRSRGMNAGVSLLPAQPVLAVSQGGNAAVTAEDGISSRVVQQQRMQAGQIRQPLAQLPAVCCEAFQDRIGC